MRSVKNKTLGFLGLILAMLYVSNSSAGISSTIPVISESTDVIAQRNGTSAQAFRVYNTYTDASNYERGIFDWSTSANILTIGVAAAGTGSSVRSIIITSGAQVQLKSGTSTLGWSSGVLYGPSTGLLGNSANPWARIYLDYTNTATVGDVTINKAAGRVNLAAAGTSLTLTNSTVTAKSHCFLNADGAPGNVVAVQLYAVPSAGSLTVNAVPAVTNQTAIDFFCVNAD